MIGKRGVDDDKVLCQVELTAWLSEARRGILFFVQAEDGIRHWTVTGVQTCALPISALGYPAARLRDPPRPGRASHGGRLARCRDPARSRLRVALARAARQ